MCHKEIPGNGNMNGLSEKFRMCEGVICARSLVGVGFVRTWLVT